MHRFTMIKFSTVIGLFSLFLNAEASADLSAPSQLSALGSVTIVEGSVEGLRNSGYWVLLAVEKAARASRVIVQNSVDGSRLVLRGSRQLTATGAFSLGHAVQISTHRFGVLIIQSGRLLALIPNELGRALVYREAY